MIINFRLNTKWVGGVWVLNLKNRQIVRRLDGAETVRNFDRLDFSFLRGDSDL